MRRKTAKGCAAIAILIVLLAVVRPDLLRDAPAELWKLMVSAATAASE